MLIIRFLDCELFENTLINEQVHFVQNNNSWDTNGKLLVVTFN